jgi:hypothetical protein
MPSYVSWCPKYQVVSCDVDVPEPECVIGSTTTSNTFYQCPTATDAYNTYPGYTCVYWDDSTSCDQSVMADYFTTTTNGHCANIAGGGAHQTYYNAST